MTASGTVFTSEKGQAEGIRKILKNLLTLPLVLIG